MVIYTGDTHGYTEKILTITDKLSLTESDTIVILGDAGYNYYGNEYGDLRKKKKFYDAGVIDILSSIV